MTRGLFILLVFVFLSVPSPLAATCWIAIPIDVVECHQDPTSTCCLVEEMRVHEVCYSAFCIDDDVCVLEDLVGQLCLARSDPPMSNEELWDHFKR